MKVWSAYLDELIEVESVTPERLFTEDAAYESHLHRCIVCSVEWTSSHKHGDVCSSRCRHRINRANKQDEE